MNLISIKTGEKIKNPVSGTIAYDTDTNTFYIFSDGQWHAIAPAEWNSILNKPSEFPPEAHTHPWPDIDEGKPFTIYTISDSNIGDLDNIPTSNIVLEITASTIPGEKLPSYNSTIYLNNYTTIQFNAGKTFVNTHFYSLNADHGANFVGSNYVYLIQSTLKLPKLTIDLPFRMYNPKIYSQTITVHEEIYIFNSAFIFTSTINQHSRVAFKMWGGFFNVAIGGSYPKINVYYEGNAYLLSEFITGDANYAYVQGTSQLSVSKQSGTYYIVPDTSRATLININSQY